MEASEDVGLGDSILEEGFLSFCMSPTNALIFSALAKAQGEIDAAEKGKFNPFHKSKYADIHDIGQAVKEPLKNNDMFYLQMWERGDSPSEIRLRTMIGHKSGEWIQFLSSIQCAEPDNPQKVGSLLTYAKRYALSGALGVTSTERSLDDDANSNSVSDKGILALLETEAQDGGKALTAAWLALSEKDRDKMIPQDLAMLKKTAQTKDKEKSNTGSSKKTIQNETEKSAVV